MSNSEFLHTLLQKATTDAKQYDRLERREDREQVARIMSVLNVYRGLPLEQLTEKEVTLAIDTCLRYVKYLDKLVYPERKPLCVLTSDNMLAYSPDEELPF